MPYKSELSELSELPDTTQGAFLHGQKCHNLGKDVSYNPYRNMENRINHLWAAWIRGWESQNSPGRPDQAAFSE